MIGSDREPSEPHGLACMEVWGGNEEVNTLVSVPGMDAHVISRPHRGESCGGDVHYLSNCAAGIISRFVLADVSGHGSGVADLARTLRGLMRRHINTADQSAFAKALNREFADAATMGRFATAILATYFAPTDHLIVCNAGHPRPLWRCAADGRWRFLDAATASMLRGDLEAPDLPLGIIEPTTFCQFAAPLARGDTVVLYTDALIEATDRDGRLLGEAGLLSIAREIGEVCPGFAQRLLDRVEAFRSFRENDDDTTVMVLHHNAADPPDMTLRDRVRMLRRMIGLG